MKPEKLIEVSFEIANKVGGIHQVIRSKSSKMKEYYGENYLTIGYYDEENARKEFGKREENPYKYIFDEMKEEYGVECHYGVWNISSGPKCILVDPSGLEKPVNEIKEYLWEEYGIDSIEADVDFDEPIKWAYAVGKLLEKIRHKENQKTVVHLHEWLSGSVSFYTDYPCVFTTHATVLGRAMSNSDCDIKKMIEQNNVDSSRAEEFEVKAKHQLEKTSAKEAEVFTTVSKNTGKEAEAILDVKPDKILPNGFNVEDFPSLEELSYQHKKKKKDMKEFLRAYFKPYYDVNLENDPRILFISGRYEYHNKGLDVFIEALSKLNQKQGEDFFVFIFVPSDVKQEKAEVHENISLYDELEEYLEDLEPDIKKTMLNSITSGENPMEKIEKIIDRSERELNSLRNNFHAKKGEKPPLSAYDLNYENDEIMEKLYQEGLHNRKGDRVKVVFYPTYLSVGDKMLSMSYNDAVVASSAGIFPSYYEPWGYTPVETAANGALSVTTDMAGFGKYLTENTDEEQRKGIQIVQREKQTREQSVEQLSNIMEDIVTYSKTEITERKHNARKLAQMTSWEKLGENYLQAHKKALKQH